MAKSKKAPATKPIIDLDELLEGNPPWEEVVRFWKEDGEFHEEYYQTDAIKKYLRTPEQKKLLDAADISIQDMLNGHYSGRHNRMVNKILKEWNKKLGFHAYGWDEDAWVDKEEEE